MKKVYLLLNFLFFSIILKAQPNLMYGERVLPLGTTVILETTQTTKPSRTSSKILDLKVRTNVMSRDGHLLIKSGAIAQAQIKSIESSTTNYPEAVYIVVLSVQAVDGQMVDLNRNEVSFSARQPGEEVVIEPLNTIIVNTTNNTIIKAF